MGIHHPVGDVKKISTHNITPPNNSNCMDFTNNGTFLSNASFWRINWMATAIGHSVTESGSSGSPLLNNNRRVIGQLFGAGACDNPNCDNPARDIANYGKFSVSWTSNNATNNRRRLDHWLDPAGTNPDIWDGCASPTISGATPVCISGNTFIANNMPTGSIWACSDNLNPPSNPSSSNAIFTAKNSNTSGMGWVGIYLNGNIIMKRDVWVGVPSFISILGNSNPKIGDYLTYEAFFTSYSYLQGIGNNLNWYLTPQGSDNYLFSYGSTCEISFNETGYYQLNIVPSNTCGAGSRNYITLDVTSNSYYSAYPNPASTVLNIELDAQASGQITTEAKRINPDKTYDVRLYDGQGNLLRYKRTKGGKVEFSVSDLPNGVYFLHVYDGISEKPEMRQIVVEH